jgi:hypothetical protein
MPLPSTYRWPLLRVSVALLAACGGSTEQPPDPDPDIGDGPSLTILTAPTEPVAVEERFAIPLKVVVRDSAGRLAANTVVEAVSYSTTEDFVGVPLTFTMPDSSGGGLGQTGEDGTITFLVWGYVYAGPARIRVNALALNVSDTAYVTVVPGPAASVKLEPADTAVLVGGQATLRATVLDAWRNVRPDPVSFRAGNAATVSSTAGGTLSGLSLGRGTVIATSGALADTTRVSVVPPGRIAAFRSPETTADIESILLLDTDGSHATDLRSRRYDCGVQLQVTWRPGNDEIAYPDTYFCSLPSSLISMTSAGTMTTLLQPEAFGGAGVMWPWYSADGQWIYFARYVDEYRRDLWRVRADGTGAAAIATPLEFGQVDIQPAPSPDGTRVAFATSRGNASSLDPLGLAMLTLASGDITLLGIPGETPRWSPTGDRIAFVQAGHVMVMAPDGSGIRTVSLSANYHVGLDWSPDGRWIVAAQEPDGAIGQVGGLVLIDTQSPAELPLAFDRRLRVPAWKH